MAVGVARAGVARLVVIGHAVPVGRAGTDRVERGVGVVHVAAVAGGRITAGRAAWSAHSGSIS